jgi:hypothetical protein
MHIDRARSGPRSPRTPGAASAWTARSTAPARQLDDEGFLAGAVVTVAIDQTGSLPPSIEHDGRRYVLRPVDAVAADKPHRRRLASTADAASTVLFDPPGVLLDRLAGRPPLHYAEEA